MTFSLRHDYTVVFVHWPWEGKFWGNILLWSNPKLKIRPIVYYSIVYPWLSDFYPSYTHTLITTWCSLQTRAPWQLGKTCTKQTATALSNHDQHTSDNYWLGSTWLFFQLTTIKQLIKHSSPRTYKPSLGRRSGFFALGLPWKAKSHFVRDLFSLKRDRQFMPTTDLFFSKLWEKFKRSMRPYRSGCQSMSSVQLATVVCWPCHVLNKQLQDTFFESKSEKQCILLKFCKKNLKSNPMTVSCCIQGSKTRRGNSIWQPRNLSHLYPPVHNLLLNDKECFAKFPSLLHSLKRDLTMFPAQLERENNMFKQRLTCFDYAVIVQEYLL